MGQTVRSLRQNRGQEDDVKRQVDGGDENQKPIYQLVNVKSGGGRLIDIIKSSARCSRESFAVRRSTDSNAQNRTEKDVDKLIHNLIQPLLYNEGRGKLVPLSRIWMSRFGYAKDEEESDSQASDRHTQSSGIESRWVCWKLEERGFVGETALHICFLLSTPTHMILARKLLSMFPMLINDIYTCDQYFGESSLHMAIVNEDVKIVRLLLDHGAHVHERCLGSFFLPMDQKDRANEVLRKILAKYNNNNNSEDLKNADTYGIDLASNQFSRMDTDYDGYAYWGEYPLSFAACLGLSDCYKLLMAKGANPNEQDSNGNATLHMAVIANRIDMFDLCYSSGANLSILNKQKLSPLTLSAKLRRVDMFFHIMSIQRQVNFIFCNVGFMQIPMANVDSINTEDGSCNDNSVLSIVVFGASNEHLQMLDGLLSQLLMVKWETSGRNRFFWWFFQFLLFLLISSVAYITRFSRVAQRVRSPSTQSTRKFEDDSIHLKINTYSEISLIFFVLYYLWITITRIVPSLGLRSFFKSLSHAPEMSLFTLTCLLILTCFPLRLLDFHQAEDFLTALIVFTLPLKLLFFCRASRSVGSFVVMIYKILVNDVLCFVVFMIVFVAGFSQSFSIIFKTHGPSIAPLNITNNGTPAIMANTNRNYFLNPFDGLISMHMMALNEFGIVFDEFDSTGYPGLAKILFCVYMILVSILLINMLIAMLGKTYQDIASQPNESLRQWARALLVVERMWTNKQRLQTLDRYCQEQPGSSLGCNNKIISSPSRNRYYGSTKALTPQDRNEIDCMKKLNEESKLSAIRLLR